MDQPTPVSRFVIPTAVVSHFHLRPGDVVADFGAGSGYFTEALASAVGPTGTVYAVEVQKPLVEKIGALAHGKGLQQVQVLWGDIESFEGTKIVTNELDAVVLINTFFQCEDKPGTLAEIVRTLRAGGKLYIVDWSESFGGLGPQPNQVITAAAATAAAETAGFIPETSFPAGDHHYGIGFRKP